MAQNRFRKIFATPNTDYIANVEQPFIPDLSGIEAVTDSLQKQFDESSKYELPKYLRESPTDKAAFSQYKADIEKYRQNMIDAFTEGDISSGQSELRNFGEYIRKSKMPEGTFFELERGVQEYQNELKSLKDTYLDPKSKLYNPYIFKYAKDKLDKGIPDFRDEFGNVRTGISGPTLNRYIPDEEVTSQLNEVLDNITADQIIIGNRVPKHLQGLSFKQILERGEKKYIDFDKVANVLGRSVSPEMMQSYNMLGEAMGLGQGQGQVQMRTDDKGRPIGFDTSTMLGRKLQGLADSKVFTQYNDQAKIISDSYGEQNALKSMDVLYSASQGRLTAGKNFEFNKVGNNLDNLNNQITQLEAKGEAITAQELITLEDLKSQRNILKTTQNTYSQAFHNSNLGKRAVASNLDKLSKFGTPTTPLSETKDIQSFAPIEWLLKNNKINKQDLERYISDPKSIPDHLRSMTIPSITKEKNVPVTGPSPGYRNQVVSNETTLGEAINQYRNSFDKEITSYSKNNPISLSSNVISAFNINGKESSNVAGTAGNLLSHMLLKQGGNFSVPDEATTLDQFMLNNGITEKDYTMEAGILDSRVGGENAYYFKATPKDTDGEPYEIYVYPKTDLGLEGALGSGLMKDALAKNGMLNRTEDPPLDLTQNDLNWTENSWQIYDTGRRKYAESVLGDSFKEYQALEQQGILLPNEEYDIYLPGMNAVDNRPLKFSKQETVKTAPDGRRFTANEFNVTAVGNDGTPISISANSINDLMLKLLQGAPQEQE